MRHGAAESITAAAHHAFRPPAGEESLSHASLSLRRLVSVGTWCLLCSLVVFTPRLLGVDIIMSAMFCWSVLAARAVKASRRQQIVKEIYESEHSYITQLNTIVNVSTTALWDVIITLSSCCVWCCCVQLFLNPARVNGLLPSAAITDIFSNIEGILSVNTELFLSMRQRSLAEAFSHLGPYLKLYSTYASNYQNALETLQVYYLWLLHTSVFTLPSCHPLCRHG